MNVIADTIRTSKRLAARLRQAAASGEPGRYRAVIMHDFALDRLVHIPSLEDFVARARTVYAQKGGLLPDSRQTLQQGGCAANTAATLARLGVNTCFIARTDELGLVLLQFYLQRAGVDISRVKLGGRLGLCTALEVGPEKINIMIDDGESFAPFGFDDLDARDLEIIASADLVGVFSWGLNRQGTDLAGRLLGYLAGQGPLTYLDTCDPAPRKDEIPELFARVLAQPHLHHLNLNENELRQYAGCPQGGNSPADLLGLAQALKARVPAQLNVHTSAFSLHVGPSTHVVPTYRLQPMRTTGAGDSWNGGNILGLLLGLEPPERLLLANAVAGYYIAAPRQARPSLGEVIEFVEAGAEALSCLTV